MCFWWVRLSWHRAVGATYGLTLRESIEIRRSLRFVLTADDYTDALAVHDAATRLGQTNQVADRLEALGKGTLDFEVTAYQARKRPDGTDSKRLDWITFKAVACVPK